MDKEKPKGVPPVTQKSLKREELGRFQRADTGGDPYNRMMGNYSKTAVVKDTDETDMFF